MRPEPEREWAAAEGLIERIRDHGLLARVLRDETASLSRRQLTPGSTQLALAGLPPGGTLEEAMRIVARAYDVLHGGRFNTVVRRGGTVSFVVDDAGFPFAVEGGAVYAAMETTLLFVHALLCVVAPGVAGPALRRVSVRRPEGRAEVPFGRWATLRLGAPRYALDYAAEACVVHVAFPPPGTVTFDAVTDEQIELLRTRTDGDVRAAEAVRAQLRRGAEDQAAIAAALSVSPATLRRRLAEEGTSFRTIRDEALRDRALALLASAEPLDAVAASLGYADVRSFNRAFRGWTGVTPAAARRGLLSGTVHSRRALSSSSPS